MKPFAGDWGRDRLYRGSVNARAAAEDLAAVRSWFERLQECCQAVDYQAGREIFAADMVAFGTFTDFMRGRDAVENQQWRNVWGTIGDFRYDVSHIDAFVSADRLMAVGLGIWQSTGFHPDGTPFIRPGRTTVVLRRPSVTQPFVAVHTHMSLFRGTPDQSYGPAS